MPLGIFLKSAFLKLSDCFPTVMNLSSYLRVPRTKTASQIKLRTHDNPDVARQAFILDTQKGEKKLKVAAL
jgi:hypothetical protein